MRSLALVVGCLIVSCAAVGLRLVALGVRDRRLPELALGLGYLLFGAVGTRSRPLHDREPVTAPRTRVCGSPPHRSCRTSA